MVILFASPHKRRELGFFSPFFFVGVYYANNIVQIQGHKGELFLFKQNSMPIQVWVLVRISIEVDV